MKRSLLPLLVLTCSLQAFAIERIKCPKASSEVPEGTTVQDYQEFFTANKIILKTNLSVNYVEQFKNEFAKFPESLHRDLMKAGNTIHIMEGSGVTVDPTWHASHVNTFDGRSWVDVPGAGGSTAAGYQKAPTRVVINHLYDKQGSVSMLIHEHAHSLDSIKTLHGISNSSLWSELLASEPKAMEFMNAICGTYCSANIEEGFAELFASYYACDASREQMEREIPRIADFFGRFTSMKKLKNIWSDVEEEEEIEVTTPNQRTPTPRKEFCRRIFGRNLCIPSDTLIR